ncbi:hypothetical protein C5748_22005 [Phyllobacterium phragmitis]|uniref:Uncharacterized protein n=1 Tax=Phyllobacterium phragmitis TaxID=2670329 RepID=A0A2S9ILL9_9HYPH|nr:DUF3102 domain-containing protein [Phyllobacterium phragmitis]PRD41408.1 hypothetical protein C5748_22005 [Phyllobacterium phragmitis]
MIHLRSQSLCAEFEIEIIPANRYPAPGQTRAVATISRIIEKRGIEHARLVMCVLAEGKGNQALIDEVSLSAISDVLYACSDVLEDNPSAVLELFDQLPLGPYTMIASEMSGFVKQSSALAGMLYLHLRKLRGEPLTCKMATWAKTSRAAISEEEKGRKSRRSSRHRKIEEKIAIGRKLLEVKASLPWGHWGPWVRDKSGLSSSMVIHCMRIAKWEEMRHEQG